MSGARRTVARSVYRGHRGSVLGPRRSPSGSSEQCPRLGRVGLESRKKEGVRQQYARSGAFDRCDFVSQSLEGSKGTCGVEAAGRNLLVRVCTRLDSNQECVGINRHPGRAGGARRDASNLPTGDHGRHRVARGDQRAAVPACSNRDAGSFRPESATEQDDVRHRLA